MREAYRSLIKENEPLKWQSVIFLARQNSLNADYNEIKKAVDDCIKKAQKKF